MLLYGHNLYGIVTVGRDARQHVVAKFYICAHPFALLGHADMTLIDEQRTRVGTKPFHLPFVCIGGPHLGREHVSVFVLHHTGGIGRDALAASAIPGDNHLVEIAVADGIAFEFQLPHTVFLGLEGIFFKLLPFGEITDERNRGGIGSPFAEHPAVGRAVEPEIIVRVGKRFELAVRAAQFQLFVYGIIVSSYDGGSIRLEPRVILEDVESLFFHN